MEERSKIHVGLDVHKDAISVSKAEPSRSRTLPAALSARARIEQG